MVNVRVNRNGVKIEIDSQKFKEVVTQEEIIQYTL